MKETDSTHGSSLNAVYGYSKSKSYEQLVIDISLCSKRVAPEAIAHCACIETQDIAITPHMPPISVF